MTFRLVLLLLAVRLPATAAARDVLPSFAPVLQRAEPAVVNVATEARGEETGEPRDMQELLRRFFGENPQQRRRRLGSGFILSADGEIVTNNHVVAGADNIRVRLSTDEELDAKVVGADEKTDVALIRVHADHPLPTLPLGDSETVQVGDWVLAIGNPFGLTQTATAGIVSAKGRFLGAGPYDDFIQTDASINPGNSGGPLIDQDGRVVGINAAIVSPAGGNVGIGFAVPTNLVRWVIDQLREHGKVVRGWIGVSVQSVTPELARSFGLSKPEGALVADVAAGGPAAKAGIARGDVVIKWADEPIPQSRELPGLVARTTPGSRAPVVILRNGRQQTVEITVAEMPATEPRAARAQGGEPTPGKWGLAVEAMSAAEAKRRGLPAGAVVADVAPGGPAEQAGLQPGDVITEVARRPVRSVDDLRRALATNADRVLLTVRRDGTSLFVEMRR